MKLPQSFNEHGLLPPGDYEMTLQELKNSMLIKGLSRPTEETGQWDIAWRGKLVDNLEILLKQIWQVGVTDIFINGSFVEDKDHPNVINLAMI